MNAHQLIQHFNPCKCFVYCCLAAFTALLALKQDGALAAWSYWTVFSPIWLWKCLVVLGAAVGIAVWFHFPQYRLEGEGFVHFRALLICLSLHLLLLMFEVLACDQLASVAGWHGGGGGGGGFGGALQSQLASQPRHMWILVFVPLVFVSFVSVPVCVWSVRHDRSCEMELCCAVNALQFVFVALKLDGLVDWRWEVILVPLWVIMGVSVVVLFYIVIFAALLLRSPTLSAQQRRSSAHATLGHCFLVLPLLVFLVLLSNKLDGYSGATWLVTVSPLFFLYLTLILLSFNSKPNNMWWFGVRRDFRTLLFDALPCLREYCNISLRSSSVSSSGGDGGGGGGDGGGGGEDTRESSASATAGHSSRSSLPMRRQEHAPSAAAAATTTTGAAAAAAVFVSLDLPD